MSTAGGAWKAPGRARKLGADALQVFTAAPRRWTTRGPDPGTSERFRAARREAGIRYVAVHDSYLINLASPDRALRNRSLAAFEAELRRAAGLGADAVVSHPGNATDGDRREGLRRNAEAIARALYAVPDSPPVLLETTAGSGSALGARFEELARLLSMLPGELELRTGVCVDTCHVFAAGYDLAGAWESVWAEFDRAVGRERLGLLHLNDSVAPLGARRDRHAHIGEGRIGAEAFRRLMRERSLADVPRILETPKGGDAAAADRANLERLRGFLARRGPDSHLPGG